MISILFIATTLKRNKESSLYLTGKIANIEKAVNIPFKKGMKA